MNKPLISICIPTYNRSEYLRRTLDSIVLQNPFDEKVEVVINDNCSTDNTEAVCKEYTDKYSNIKYFKNEQNVRDENFPICLSRATGTLRKLCNDTLVFEPGTLDYLIKIAEQNKVKKPVIFNQELKSCKEELTECKDMESFLHLVSFNITWIGGFSVWEEDCTDLPDCKEGCTEKLWQVPYLLKLLARKQDALLITKKLFTTQQVKNKNISYGVYKVFYVNYLSFIKKYVEKDIITNNLYDWLEEDLLFNFFKKWMLNFEKQSGKFQYSDSENLIKLVTDSYKDKPYFYRFKREYKWQKTKNFIKEIIKHKKQ